MKQETRWRSVAKAATFRIIAMIVGFTIAYAFTHRVDVSISIMLVRDAIMTAVYFWHERTWQKIRWGID
jgi:uncharacterized membrane protein